MAIVIDAVQLVRDKKRLPKEAFFVDTNVVLDYVDPFSRSLELDSVARPNARVREVMSYLKSHQRVYSTVGVALEYYKHIQVGFYQVQTGKIFQADDFKMLRNNDVEFINRWDGQIKAFKKVFTKNFPLYDAQVPVAELVSDFQGGACDFGDHVLCKSVLQCDDKLRCIFSNDSDFYSFPDNLLLLTTSQSIIKQAREHGNLHEIK